MATVSPATKERLGKITGYMVLEPLEPFGVRPRGGDPKGETGFAAADDLHRTSLDQDREKQHRQGVIMLCFLDGVEGKGIVVPDAGITIPDQLFRDVMSRDDYESHVQEICDSTPTDKLKPLLGIPEACESSILRDIATMKQSIVNCLRKYQNKMKYLISLDGKVECLWDDYQKRLEEIYAIDISKGVMLFERDGEASALKEELGVAKRTVEGHAEVLNVVGREMSEPDLAKEFCVKCDEMQSILDRPK